MSCTVVWLVLSSRTLTLPPLTTACLVWGLTTCMATSMSLPERRKKIWPDCVSFSSTALVYCTHSNSAVADLKLDAALSMSARTVFRSVAGAGAVLAVLLVADCLLATAGSARQAKSARIMAGKACRFMCSLTSIFSSFISLANPGPVSDDVPGPVANRLQTLHDNRPNDGPDPVQ